jgi:prepilin-type processing-associated H-X9-DG protein/prepilin-type N-terminal cleavage/methylation domain-containing protein
VGFTIVELLVVIVIISALVTLAVPATARIQSWSKASHCMGNLRSIGTALNLYLSEHNNMLPEMVMGRESKDSDEPAIDTVLSDYTSSKEVFHCIADSKHLFEKTGSSYLWNHLLNGQNTASMDFMGFIKDSVRIPVVSDKENFHKYQGVEVNILYADGHVAKEVQFVVGGK